MSLTNYDFFKIQACDMLLGTSALTKAERYAQVVRAKTVRNFWFTSTLFPVFIDAANPNGPAAVSYTPRFSRPVILTDMISLFDARSVNPDTSGGFAGNVPYENLVAITRYGGEGAAYGENFFHSLLGPGMSWLIVKHERNRIASVVVPDAPELFDKYLSFVPRLLKPSETLKIKYQAEPTADFIRQQFPHLGFRAVRPLLPGDEYQALSPLADRQVQSYINSSKPETFLLEVRTTLASLGVINTGSVVLSTPQLDRPVLILGAASNVEGCQCQLSDPAEDYQFTYQEQSPDAALGGSRLRYVDPPLQLIAPNTDYRNVNMFNMWPVPHVFEPGRVLKLTLSNGCFPRPIAGSFGQAAATRGSQDVRIVFLCRTV